MIQMYAAKYGNLELLKWLNENGMIIYCDAGICLNAVKYGHLDVLLWGKETGCYWNGCYWNGPSILYHAEKHKHIMAYYENNNCMHHFEINNVTMRYDAIFSLGLQMRMRTIW